LVCEEQRLVIDYLRGQGEMYRGFYGPLLLRFTAPNGQLAFEPSGYDEFGKPKASHYGLDVPLDTALDMLDFLLDAKAEPHRLEGYAHDGQPLDALDWFFLRLARVCRSAPDPATLQRLSSIALKFLDSVPTLTRTILSCFSSRDPQGGWLAVGHLYSRSSETPDDPTSWRLFNNMSGCHFPSTNIVVELSLSEVIHNALAWMKKFAGSNSSQSLRELEARVDQIGRGVRRALCVRNIPAWQDEDDPDQEDWEEDSWEPSHLRRQRLESWKPSDYEEMSCWVSIEARDSDRIFTLLDELADARIRKEREQEVEQEIVNLADEIYASGTKVEGMIEPSSHHSFEYVDPDHFGLFFTDPQAQLSSLFSNLQVSEAHGIGTCSEGSGAWVEREDSNAEERRGEGLSSSSLKSPPEFF